jgi:hypothetical protein
LETASERPRLPPTMNLHRTSVGAPAPLSANLLLALVAAGVAAAQDPPKSSTVTPPKALADAFQQALAQMRADKAPGLVFVLPPAGARADREVAAQLEGAIARGKLSPDQEPRIALKTARDVLLAQLQALRASQESELAALMLLTVPIVAEPAVAGSKPGETIVLLSPTGERVAGFAADPGDHAAGVEARAPSVLAKKVVEPRRTVVPPALAKIAERHTELQGIVRERLQRGEGPTGEEIQELQKLHEELAGRLTAAAPALVELHGERATLGASPGFKAQPFEAAMPFGTEVDQMWDPCPPCGMMATPLPMRSTLKLLAR